MISITDIMMCYSEITQKLILTNKLKTSTKVSTKRKTDTGIHVVINPNMI